jgi:hypothetical protein
MWDFYNAAQTPSTLAGHLLSGAPGLKGASAPLGDTRACAYFLSKRRQNQYFHFLSFVSTFGFLSRWAFLRPASCSFTSSTLLDDYRAPLAISGNEMASDVVDGRDLAGDTSHFM